MYEGRSGRAGVVGGLAVGGIEAEDFHQGKLSSGVDGVLDRTEIISEAKDRWDVLRGEALPPRQSRELIREAVETWKPES